MTPDFKALHERITDRLSDNDDPAFNLTVTVESARTLLAALELAQQVARLQRECLNWEREQNHLQEELALASTEARNNKVAMEANRDAAMGYQDRALAAESENASLKARIAELEAPANVRSTFS